MSSKFRLCSKKFFLTFPQNATAKEVAKDVILASYPATVWFMICQEKHQDGELHLHIGIEFASKLDTRLSSYFDSIGGGKHGNYQGMRSVSGTLKYLKKSDPEPLIHGTVPEPNAEGKGSKKGDAIAVLMNEGASLEDVFAQEPGYFLMHKRKIEDLQGWLAVKKMKENLEAFPGRFVYMGQCLQTTAIVEWLNGNLFKDARPFKAPQLYVYGAAGSRKTSLVTMLERWARVYWVPNDEEFYDFYSDTDYDLIVFDEFKLQKKLQWLNKFIEGAPCPIRKKGVAAVMKRKNLPVIFLSNYSTEELLKDKDDWNLFNARVLSIGLYNPIDIPNIYAEAITVPVSPCDSPSPHPPPLSLLFCDEETLVD